MAILPDIINRLFPARIEQRASVTDSSWFQVINGITGSGKVASVTPRTAMAIGTVYSCVNLITETATLVPPKIYKYGINGKTLVRDHDQLPILTKEANPYTSSIEWDKIWTASYLIWGNGYAEIRRNGRTGRPMQYVNLEPWLVEPDYVNGEKVYVYSPDGTFEPSGNRVIKSRDMLHLADLSWNNLKGESRIKLNANTINEGLSVQNYAREMYENGSHMMGLLISDAPMSMEALELLRSAIERKYSTKSGQLGALPKGVTYQQLNHAMPMADADLIEAKKMAVEDIARIFRCPLTLIQRGESADNKGDNEYNTFLTTVIAPLVLLKSAELNRKIFRKAEMADHYVKYELKGLYRTDIKTRYEAHRTALDGGFMCIDEVREIEDLDPLQNGLGQTFRVPMNYMSLENFKDYNPTKKDNATN